MYARENASEWRINMQAVSLSKIIDKMELKNLTPDIDVYSIKVIIII